MVGRVGEQVGWFSDEIEKRLAKESGPEGKHVAKRTREKGRKLPATLPT